MMYIHKDTRQRIVIRKQVENGIVVCDLIDEPKEFNVKGELVYPIVITKMEN